MGVRCQIHLRRPADGVYRAGGLVRGTVKYALDTDTRYKDIVVSLRGEGHCSWTEGSGDSRKKYHGSEDYVNVSESLLEKKQEDDETSVAAGVYSRPFHFTIPTDVPGSYHDTVCTIKYYVKLKFERKGAFNFDKTFCTVIPVENTTVKSDLRPEPITYGAQKSLLSLFNRAKKVVNIKATVERRTFAPGDTARLDVEINNSTDVEIPTIKTKLYNKVVRIANCGNKNSHFRNVDETRRCTEAVKERSVTRFTRDIEIPPDHHTIQYSKILEREYFLKIKAKVPFPHTNLILEIPVLIGNLEEEDSKETVEDEDESCDDIDPLSDDLPPSYWEVMQEDKINTKENDGYEKKEAI